MPDLKPTRRTVVRTAAWSVPAVTLVSAAPAFAASSNYTDLSSTAPVAPVRVLDATTQDPTNVVQMPTTLEFTNTGDLDSDGATVQITSSIPVEAMTVGETPIEGLFGITISPSLTTGPQTNFTLTVPPVGLLAIPAGSAAGLPVPLDLALTEAGPVVMQMTVTGMNPAATSNIPFISPEFTIA